jgi:ankyrin repeat protein
LSALSLIECACGGPTRLDDLTFLIDKGMDLDDEWAGLSPLMHACAAGATAQPGVEALVRAGADVDLQNKASGITALMVAVNNNNATAVSFLLDHSGATPGLLDHSGHSALQCAYERGLAAIATKLVKALASPPAKVTTVAREKLLDARRKAAAAKRAEAAEKQAAMDKKIKAAMETE